MNLRLYQVNAVRELLRLLKGHRRVVAVGPTGSGKTVIGAALLLALSGVRVLWVAHHVELLEQAFDELKEHGIPESDLGILTSTKKVNPSARILIASVGMFRSREVPDVDLLVIDEAHHVTAASYRAIVDARPDAWLLGLTATPERLDGEPLGDVFTHLHVMAEAVELIADGHLLPGVVYGIPEKAARQLVKGASNGGRDYSASKLEEMTRRPLMADIIRERQGSRPGSRPSSSP